MQDGLLTGLIASNVNALADLAGSVSIREAQADDEAVIEALRRSVGWSSVDTGLVSMARGRSVVYLLEVDGGVAASGALVFRGEDPELADGATSALISNLIVNPSFQKRGLGTHLLHYLEAQAQRRGFQRVTIGVDVPNAGARHLYEREGYGPLKDKSEAWGPVNYLVRYLPQEK